MITRCDLAPLDGITKIVFRRVWGRHFGGADRCFIPFFSPTPQHILTPRDRRELEPPEGAGLPQVPQVMTCKAEDFLWAAEAVRDLGYPEINLNLGCPSGTVTAKGKGAGFLAKPEELVGALLIGGEFDDYVAKVFQANGFQTEEELADEAKN